MNKYTMKIEDDYFVFYRDNCEIYYIGVSDFIRNNDHWSNQMIEKEWFTDSMMDEMKRHALTLR